MSGDRDLLQLVGPLIEVFMPKGQDGVTVTAAAVQESWGVRPDQFIDLKALIGQIMTSRAYQAPAVERDPKDEGEYLFRGPAVRRITAAGNEVSSVSNCFCL